MDANSIVTMTISSEDHMRELAAKLAHYPTDNLLIFLQGTLGAGKTTFTRAYLHALGYSGKVKSPTYALVEPYEITDKKIFHFDFYRIQEPSELFEMGIQEYFNLPSICLIEWPESVREFIPPPDLVIHIKSDTLEESTARGVQIRGASSKGKELLAQLFPDEM